ncbi:MAG: Rossmann-like domain-containing protein [Smithellaceae bacterium]
MLKPGTILNRLYECVEPAAINRQITDLRAGLSYVGVKLDNGAAGLAAVLPDITIRGCTVLSDAGNYRGTQAVNVLRYLVDGTNALHLAIGLATANALIESASDKTEDREATTCLNLQPGEKVAMVGLFAPLVERINATGAILTVIEKNPERLELLSQEERQQALKDCNVAIITATTLLNNTFEETIDALGAPRAVTLMGPSTPLMPAIFHDTPVTHLGGATVADSSRVLQIISEGGGTPALRPYLRFVNLISNLLRN